MTYALDWNLLSTLKPICIPLAASIGFNEESMHILIPGIFSIVAFLCMFSCVRPSHDNHSWGEKIILNLGVMNYSETKKTACLNLLKRILEKSCGVQLAAAGIEISTFVAI